MVPQLKHVCQKHRYGCGPACVAMIAGLEYDEVIKDFGGDSIDATHGVTHHCTDIWLCEHGYAISRKWRYKNNVEVDLRSIPLWADVNMVMVDIAAGTHFVILLSNGTVLDPNRESPTNINDPAYIRVCQIAGVHKFEPLHLL